MKKVLAGTMAMPPGHDGGSATALAVDRAAELPVGAVAAAPPAGLPAVARAPRVTAAAVSGRTIPIASIAHRARGLGRLGDGVPCVPEGGELRVAVPRIVSSEACVATGGGNVGPSRTGPSASITRLRSDQKASTDAYRSEGSTVTARAKTASTSADLVFLRRASDGRSSPRVDAAPSSSMVSPASGARPLTSSRSTSASANTSVHGPVVPIARENCSGAPYAGVNAVNTPVFLKAPASRTSSTTFAMPKSRSLTTASGPRASPTTKTFAGFTSR